MWLSNASPSGAEAKRLALSATRHQSRPRRPHLTLAEGMAAAAMDPVEAAKRAAAEKAVDEFVRDGMVVGIGSGSTIVYAVHRLAARAKLPEGDPLRISTAVFVPTSFQSRQVSAAR